MSAEQTDSAGWYDLLAWAEIHKKRLIYAGAAILGVGMVFSFVRWQGRQAELSANVDLFKLHILPSRTSEKLFSGASEYRKVAEAHGGTAAAERARLLAGGALFSEGKYSEAQAEFNRFLADLPNGRFASDAAYGVAASLEAQGKSGEAQTAYQDVVTRYPTSGVATQARLALARLNEMGNKPAEALRIYDDLNKPGSFTAWTSEVAKRRSQLLALHPELAVTPATTNAPKVTITRVTTNGVAGSTSNLPEIKIQTAPAPQ